MTNRYDSAIYYAIFIRGETLNMVDYEILDPDLNYRGKSYSSLVTDWFNYFISTDPDKRSLGPVVFLKSVPAPKLVSGGGPSNVANEASVSSPYSADPYYPRNYENNPNVRVGGDKLQIFTDQAVFLPILMAYEIATKPYQSWGELQEYTGAIMDNGDDPPEEKQITIDGKPIVLPPKMEMTRFRILTPVFTTVVPDIEYGRSLRDVLEDDVPPGQFATVVEGYCLLVKFNPPKTPKTYVLHSLAKAGHEQRGLYTAEILCQIEVNERPKKSPSEGVPIGVRSARNVSVIMRILCEKIKHCELTIEEANNILSAAGLPPIPREKEKV
jgi:hypothetical protein